MRKSQSPVNESLDTEFAMDDDGSNDDDFNDSDSERRPDSVDDKVRKKEMRRGIDLATTLERIEKNFVITDPRLPDNPIVRFLLISFPPTMLFSEMRIYL
jgi:hypothetical protein